MLMIVDNNSSPSRLDFNQKKGHYWDMEFPGQLSSNASLPTSAGMFYMFYFLNNYIYRLKSNYFLYSTPQTLTLDYFLKIF